MKRASAETRLLDSPSRVKPGDSAATPQRRGVCRVCGCTDDHPCIDENFHCCVWVDANHTLCDNLDCIAVVPMSELELMVPEIEAT